MRPAEIADLVEASDPRVSPDGNTVAFVVTTVDLEGNAYRSAVWVAGTGPEFPACPFTGGTAREARPRWSPDGEQLAFVSHPDDSGARLNVASVDGEGAFELLAWPEDIEDVLWTPDGTQLVFSARQRDEARYAPSKDKDRPARRIDRLSSRVDNAGWTIDRPRHLFVIAADESGGEVIQLTSGPFDDKGFAIAPDGESLVFSSARTDTWDTDLSTHLYRIALRAGAEPEQLTDGSATHESPSLSTDGRHVAFVWGDRHSMTRHGQIGVVELAGGAERVLTTTLDRHCAPYLSGARDPVWDGDSLLFQVDDAGNVPLFRVTLDGETSLVASGDRQITAFDAAAGTLAFVATTPTRLPEVFAVVDGDERRLTRVGDAFAKAHPSAEPTRFTATSTDGVEVEGWLLRPPVGTGPAGGGDRIPVLLNIHGGPFSQYGNRFFDEFQVEAAAGYAVLYANPRGSSGYSEVFARGIRGPRAAEDPGTGWGGIDYDDVMAVVDEALDRFDDLDGERLGVIGGSYGGYLTSWIIGHTDRFKAACSERACNNLFTFAHTSDIGASFPAGYIGATHLADPDEFARQSPVTYYRDMATPLLILHSDNDLRCPIEQAEDLFVRLKMTGRDVEFVRFPGEGHELSRSGAPKHRVERLEVILDWFARKL